MIYFELWTKSGCHCDDYDTYEEAVSARDELIKEDGFGAPGDYEIKSRHVCYDDIDPLDGVPSYLWGY
jgi:hypothetical protein